MTTNAIPLLDKDDYRPLPPIPEEILEDINELYKNVINNQSLSHLEKLGEVYAFLDRCNQFVSTFSVCGKGCSHCCKIDVSVSQLEAEYITATGGPRIKPGSDQTFGHSSACPFLGDDNTCTIYDRRPFNCRTLHTLDDPKYCADPHEIHHQLYGAPFKDTPDAEFPDYCAYFYTNPARWILNLHRQYDLPYRDIRDWFPNRPSAIQRLKAWFSS
ncbi:MAG: YkgJ family cysteine cluster protein [Sphingomonadaceae bacterium]